MSGSSSVHFERLAILGMGLLGGSVALAARERGIAAVVAAASRTRSRLEDALARGVVYEIGTVAEAVCDADLVLLASPVEAMPALVREAAPHLREGVVVTDVGSVKACLAETLPGLLPAGTTYVGAHPMAGSHEQGVQHARADLFEGAVCVVTPVSTTAPEDLGVVERFWGALGALVIQRDPGVHDSEVAWISHVPHVLAFAFSRSLARAPEGAAAVVGSGFRDFTRIAQSDARLWRAILDANRKELAAPLQAFREALEELADAIEREDGAALEDTIERAREKLEEFGPTRGVYEARNLRSAPPGGENPES